MPSKMPETKRHFVCGGYNTVTVLQIESGYMKPL